MTPLLFSCFPLSIRKNEVLRYFRSGAELPDYVETLLDAAILKAQSFSTFKVCYNIYSIHIQNGAITFNNDFSVKSSALSDNLAGYSKAVVFCATGGCEFDRKIGRGVVFPVEGLVWDAVGTAAVEQLCDDFCAHIHTLTPRFSPGYADLPLAFQKTVIDALSADSALGVSLTDSLLMVPTKSVTAIAAVE